MPGYWKHLVFGFFSITGVLAFLTLVANEIEFQEGELTRLRIAAESHKQLAQDHGDSRDEDSDKKAA